MATIAFRLIAILLVAAALVVLATGAVLVAVVGSRNDSTTPLDF